MFTKIGATVAAGAFPVLLWAGAASAQQSQSQSQSQSTLPVTTPSTISTIGSTDTSGTLARTGAEDMLPLAVGGVAIAGAVAVRSFRRRSVA